MAHRDTNLMNWASKYIEQLQNNKSVQFKPHGNSMTGLIESDQLVTITPITRELKEKDIVLCRVNGKVYLHKIIAIDKDKFQIGNNKGRINGWIDKAPIYGKCTKVED